MGTVILKDKVGALRDIGGSSRRLLPKAGRSAPLWTTVVMFAMAWSPEMRASPNPACPPAEPQHAAAVRNLGSLEAANNGDSGAVPPGRGGNDRSVQVVQATVSDTGQASKQEYNWAETLSCELTNARRDIELLQRLEQERKRAEWLEQGLAAARRDVEAQAALVTKAVEDAARVKQAAPGGPELLNSLQEVRERAERLERDLAAARRDVETQTVLATRAGEETSRLKAAGDGGVADLQRERERSAQLEQDLEAARRDAETQTALAAKAGEEASRLKGTRESGDAELQSSLQRERERTAQLEQDLAAARGDLEAQIALATKTKEEALGQKRAAEAGAAELRQSRERADALAQDLSLSRSSIYAYEAQARKAVDEAEELRQAAASGTASVRKLTPEERERFAQLEQDLAAARGDIVTQTARAAKASEEVSRLKQEMESGAAELQSSLQKERERSARLEQDLAVVRRDSETKTALVTKAGEETYRLKAAEKSGAADLQKERERSARLEHDLAAARHDVETQTARAAKASEEALLQKQTAEVVAAEMKQSLARADAQAQSRSLSQSAIAAYGAQAGKAGNEAAELGQGTANGAPSLRKAAEALDQRERLEQKFAPAQGAASDVKTTGSTARDKSIEVAANPVVISTPAAPARGAAQPNTEQAAEAAALVARASSLLRQGDIGAARLVLERAVEIGSAQASFALAETYDPLILAKWGTYGTRGDARRAHDLYARADAEGIQEAKSRLDALRR